jgi:micrococcal nuclease
MRSLLSPALLCLAVLAACGMPTPRPASVAVDVPQAPVTPQTSAAPGEQVRELRVKDGDSFVLVDGREVRVLGIDSCEMSTAGGPVAKAAAEKLLRGATLTLRAEPGVDLDRFERMLRYVDVHSPQGVHDFGEKMVSAPHTGVYAGKNDAAPSYVDRLRRADQGWDCAGATPQKAVAAPVKPAPKSAQPSRAPKSAPRPAPKPTTAPKSKASSGSGFSNCAAARAAGAAPVHRGEPGYASRLDRDGDGVGCE